MNKVLADLIGGALKPITEMVDELTTSGEERGRIRQALYEAQAKIVQATFEFEQNVVDSAESIIVAEAQSESWLTKNWRPVTMLTFVALVVAHWLGYTAENISPAELADLLSVVKVGLGGYIAFRSGEKIAKSLTESRPVTEKINKWRKRLRED